MMEYIGSFEEYVLKKTGETVDETVYSYMRRNSRAFMSSANILDQTFRQKKWWDDNSPKMVKRLREELGWLFNPWWQDMHDSGIDCEADITIEAVKLAVQYNRYIAYRDKYLTSQRIKGAVEAKNILHYCS